MHADKFSSTVNRNSNSSLRSVFHSCMEPQDDGVDPLDAFMATEINPEVKAKEAEERQRKEEERRLFAKQLAVSPNLQLIWHT